MPPKSLKNTIVPLTVPGGVLYPKVMPRSFNVTPPTDGQLMVLCMQVTPLCQPPLVGHCGGTESVFTLQVGPP